MEYALFAIWAAVGLTLMYGQYSQGEEIQKLKNKVRFMENQNARLSREVNVHHHHYAKELAKGVGRAAVIGQGTAPANNFL